MPTIPHTDLDVYPLSLGTNTFGWTSSPEESFAVLDEYAAAGGNFIDTADVYPRWAPGRKGGESEEIIGDWLTSRGRRNEMVVATKVGKLDPYRGMGEENVRRAVEGSLRRLQTDYIDVLYSHTEDPENPTSPALFEALAQEGKIRYYALSNHSPEKVRETVETAKREDLPGPVALQPHYNMLFRGEYEQGLAPVAAEYDLAVIPYFSLAAGLLTGKYDPNEPITGERAEMVKIYLDDSTGAKLHALQTVADQHNVEPAAVAIAWLLAQPTITAALASARTTAQLPALLEGVSIVLSDEELRMLNQD